MTAAEIAKEDARLARESTAREVELRRLLTSMQASLSQAVAAANLLLRLKNPRTDDEVEAVRNLLFAIRSYRDELSRNARQMEPLIIDIANDQLE